MKTNYIYAMSAAVLMAVSIPACSDNVDSGLEPTQKMLELTVDGHETAYTMNCSARQDAYEIFVESNTLWHVEATSTGGWISVDKVSGRGNEAFSVTLRDNMLEARTGSVTVFTVDAEGNSLGDNGKSLTITIRQEVSNVRLNPSSVEPFKASGNSRQLFRVEANVEWTLDVSYDDDNADYITIQPESGIMTQESSVRFKGNGEASFYMGITDNRTATDRRAYLDLRSDVGSYSVEIRQARADYTFEVTPSSTQYISPKGDDIEFGIYSLSDWVIVSDDDLSDWLTFTETSGQAADRRVTTVATVKPNLTRSQRKAHIEFKPTSQQYGSIPVDIIQEAFTMTFSVSPNDLTEVVTENGGSYSINVSSMFNWEIGKSADWISVSVDKGTQSSDAVQVNVRISPNSTDRQREDVITVVPFPTDFEGFPIDPKDLGIGAMTIPVTQFGGQKPAVSVPWLSDGVTQKEAELSFNYYSPYIDIVSAGLEWKSEDASEWEKVDVNVTDAKSGTVTFRLTGLKPMEGYVARGYVIASDSKSYPGTAMLTFETAGQLPGSGDNPTPTK